MWPTVVLSAIALYVIYKILLLLGTVLTAPLVTAANVIYRIYHPPNFPISYYIFNNGLLSMVSFPFEYLAWIVLKVVAFVVLLPFDFLTFVVKLVLSVIRLLNTVILSVIMVKLIVALISVYYFRNLIFNYIPVDLSKWDLSEISLGQISRWLTG
ncbi:AAEL013273-PA [Aedes aegypti]|uniref:AAEL013273-PA n=1 Tax=Aedes aegypti TaxID=7159 RepID=Q0IE89_AEDAE|nr:AAEL013273-PA [Aedes aegypti]